MHQGNVSADVAVLSPSSLQQQVQLNVKGVGGGETPTNLEVKVVKKIE